MKRIQTDIINANLNTSLSLLYFQGSMATILIKLGMGILSILEKVLFTLTTDTRLRNLG